MVTITLEVHDHLATKIDSMRDRLPDLFSEVLMLAAPDNGIKAVPSMRLQVS